MNSHFVGNSALTPDPSPAGRGEQGTSLAVLRFVDAIRGEAVHVPGNVFKTVSVTDECRYCLKCCRVKMHDVLRGLSDEFLGEKIGMDVEFSLIRCRSCGKEGVG
jgi:hypothetical protein